VRLLWIGLITLAAMASPIESADARDTAGATSMAVVPPVLRPDMAYLLMRTNKGRVGLFALRHVLMRIPSQNEMESYRTAKKLDYEAKLPKLRHGAKDAPVPTIESYSFNYKGSANAFYVDYGKYIEDGSIRTLLIEMPAGEYIIYGSAWDATLYTCNCLGTVRFNARAGMITNLGALYVDQVVTDSPVPHLEDNVGRSMGKFGGLLGQALIPADARTSIPAALRGYPITPARFEVVGQYYEPGAPSINRLAPIPGLLGYVRGKPVDLRTGKAAD
jgi:hypothetical protein